MDPGASTPAQSEQQPGIPEAVAAARNLLIAAASLDPAYSMMHELAGSDKDSKAMAAALATIYDSHVDSRDFAVRRLTRDALVCVIVADSKDWSRRAYFEQAMAIAFGRVLRSEADQKIFAALLHSFSKIVTMGSNERVYFNNELGELLESLTDEQRDTIFEGYCEVTDAEPFFHPMVMGPRKKRSASAKRSRQAQCSDTCGRQAQCSDACNHAQEPPMPAFQPPTPAFPPPQPLLCSRCLNEHFCAMSFWYTQLAMQGWTQLSPATAGGADPSGQRRRSPERHRPGSSHDRW